MPITWPEPDVLLEAGEDGPARRAQRANRAALDVLAQKHQAESAQVQLLQKRLRNLKASLTIRLMGDPGSLTDFKRFTLTTLLADVERLIQESQNLITHDAGAALNDMADLGESAADEPLKAANLRVAKGLLGLDPTLVMVANDQLVDLLTQPMQQFGSDVKLALRGVALAGDQKFEAIQKLRDKIAGQGFDNAQYRAERIIRTELGRVFNEATYSRLVQLSVDFRFLRKGWRATKDGRTRIGHREAGQLYVRGQGIKLSERFRVNVYDERGKAQGKAPKFQGIASLRFPVDPQGQPQGKLAAGATIMCRCNAFVDFDLAEFAAHTKAKVAVALGQPGAGTPPPMPPAPPPPPAPKPTPPKAPVIPKAPKPKPVPKPKATPMPVVPTPAQVTPKPAVKAAGSQISGKLQIPAGKMWDWAREAMAVIDQVNGDGPLGAIPLLKTASRKYAGQFTYNFAGKGVKMSISGSGLKRNPRLTLAHESGHWIDTEGANRASENVYAHIPSAAAQAIIKFRAAVKASRALQTLQSWRLSTSSEKLYLAKTAAGTPTTGYEGDGTIPKGVDRAYAGYLMQASECWARAYAQYVAMTSRDPLMMAELIRARQHMSTGKVPANAVMDHPALDKVPGPRWQYAGQWDDADFEPIRQAMDEFFEAMGWRTK